MHSRVALGVPAYPSAPAASSGAGLVAEELPDVQESCRWEWEGGAVAACAEALSWLKHPELVKPEEHKGFAGSVSSKCPSWSFLLMHLENAQAH